jgi:hypothetical protein
MPNEPPLRLKPSQLYAYWKDLAHKDGARAYNAIFMLSQDGTSTVPFLAQRLKPEQVCDSAHLNGLITNLNARDYTVRQRAEKELGELRHLAEPALRRALQDGPSLELRQRVERLLREMNHWSPDALRVLRTQAVLEHIATAEARRVLQCLASGNPEAQLTQEAQAALSRLRKLDSCVGSRREINGK